MAVPGDLVILINGAPYAGWLEFKSEHHYDHATGTCDLKVSPLPGVGLPIKVGDKFQAILKGRPIITGYVHEVSGNDDWGHDYRMIHARDQTQDFHDSTVGPQTPPKPPTSLQQVLQQTVSGMGLSIPVVDKVSPEQFEKGEVPSGRIDETGFQFGDRMARQRQVHLNTDGAGSLVINRNMGMTGPGMLFRGPPDTPGNNILKARYRHSDLNRHNQHSVTSQHSTNDKTHWQSKPKSEPTAQSGPISKEWGVCNDNNVRPQRRKHHRAGHSLQRGKAKGAAAWRSNVSKGRGFQYTATVQGFEAAPGAVWWHGYVIPVFDYKYDLSAELLIVDVRFHLTWGGGSTTEITLSFKDSFSDKCGASSGADGRTSSYGNGAPSTYEDADLGSILSVPT